MWNSMKHFLETTTNLCALVPSPGFVASKIIGNEQRTREAMERIASAERLRQSLILPGHRRYRVPADLG